jgi:hypothetical protein
MAGGGQGAAAQQSSGQVYGGMPIGNAHAPQPQAMPQAMPMLIRADQGMANPFNPDGTRNQSADYFNRYGSDTVSQMTMPLDSKPQNPYGGQVAPALPQAPSGGITSLLGNQGVDVVVHGQPYNQQGNGQQMIGAQKDPTMPQYVPGQGYSEMMGMPVYHGGSLYNGPKENLS